MKKILVPYDGTRRGLAPLTYIRKEYSPDKFEVILIMVHDNPRFITEREYAAEIRREMDKELIEAARELRGFNITRMTAIGKPGARVLECADSVNADLIVLVNSTNRDSKNVVGETAGYILRHAPCNVLFINGDLRRKKGEYNGLVYRKAQGRVTLRGRLSSKKSECLLPSAIKDSIYHIKVRRGDVRFLHKAYDPGTGEWDSSPKKGQLEIFDISEGDSVRIPVNAKNERGKTDRIRIINRHPRTEAVFEYSISGAGRKNGYMDDI